MYCRSQRSVYDNSMIFSKKNAGKWVASKNEKVVATSKNLKTLLKKVEKRDDRASIVFDLVPKHLNLFGGWWVRWDLNPRPRA